MRKFLKEKRLKKGYTQKQLASELGMTTESYQRIELGTRNSTMDIWIRLSEILDADIKELYTITD